MAGQQERTEANRQTFGQPDATARFPVGAGELVSYSMLSFRLLRLQFAQFIMPSHFLGKAGAVCLLMARGTGAPGMIFLPLSKVGWIRLHDGFAVVAKRVLFYFNFLLFSFIVLLFVNYQHIIFIYHLKSFKGSRNS